LQANVIEVKELGELATLLEAKVKGKIIFFIGL
jgi:hypothetical protein